MSAENKTHFFGRRKNLAEEENTKFLKFIQKMPR
jgi:hypothetical protein